MVAPVDNDTDVYTTGSTQNFAIGNRAVLTIASAKQLELYLSRFSLPEVTTKEVRFGIPFSDVRLTPNKLDFGNLVVSFYVDEKYQNWRMLFQWLAGISRPTEYAEYADRVTDFSDGMLHVFDANNQKSMIIQFVNLVPISLDKLDLNMQATQPETLVCSAEFGFDYYKILDPVTLEP